MTVTMQPARGDRQDFTFALIADGEVIGTHTVYWNLDCGIEWDGGLAIDQAVTEVTARGFEVSRAWFALDVTRDAQRAAVLGHDLLADGDAVSVAFPLPADAVAPDGVLIVTDTLPEATR